MIRAAMLARLGVDKLDDLGTNCIGTTYRAGAGMWAAPLIAPPGGTLSAFLVQMTGTGRTETVFQFKATPCDGQHRLDSLLLGDEWLSAPLEAACDLWREARTMIRADQGPDLAALALLHLGAIYREPMPLSPEEAARPIEGGFSLDLWC